MQSWALVRKCQTGSSAVEHNDDTTMSIAPCRTLNDILTSLVCDTTFIASSSRMTAFEGVSILISHTADRNHIDFRSLQVRQVQYLHTIAVLPVPGVPGI